MVRLSEAVSKKWIRLDANFDEELNLDFDDSSVVGTVFGIMSRQYFEKAIEDGLFDSVGVAETEVEDAVVEVVDFDMEDEAAEVVELLDSD